MVRKTPDSATLVSTVAVLSAVRLENEFCFDTEPRIAPTLPSPASDRLRGREWPEPGFWTCAGRSVLPLTRHPPDHIADIVGQQHGSVGADRDTHRPAIGHLLVGGEEAR
jgi:hypothetical protein